MKNILLINKEAIPHYRVPVYNYLSEYLRNGHFNLTILAEGVQEGNPYPIQFQFKKVHLSFTSLSQLIIRNRPDAIIYWINFELFKFPFLLLAKCLNIKTIYWGHGRDLQDPNASIKNLVYSFEHWINDGIILYAGHLKKNIRKSCQAKTFIANNTLNLTMFDPERFNRGDIKRKYGISTDKNIICLGRMQRRKRIYDLIQAFRLLDLKNVGLILAGPDSDGIIKGIEGRNIFKVGPIYGDESARLLAASDVFCLPGAIGLGVVDAFYCGLPVITENVNHGPEIMYLKDGKNGFVVPKGDIGQLAQKLRMLLSDDTLRANFSQAARNEILTNGHIDRLCEGFMKALQYVLGKHI